MSKVVKRLICRQLVAYLQQNGLLPELLTAYRCGHSTETADLKIISDFLAAADHGEVTLLSLLDLSAAFDTGDHHILLDRLYYSFGLGDKVLSWITSFISWQTQRVLVGNQNSTYSTADCGVQQGSVLTPILLQLTSSSLLHATVSVLTCMLTMLICISIHPLTTALRHLCVCSHAFVFGILQ